MTLKLNSPLPFTVAENFRELGGYPAAGGKTVRRGCLYRTAALKTITSPEDVALFDSLGIRTILDLRSASERENLPDPGFAGVEYIPAGALFDDDGAEIDLRPGTLPSPAEMMAGIRQGGRNDFMAEIYRRLPLRNEAYRTLFRLLLEERTPLLFHCSAGKDRTGIAAALILLALGASRETVIADYMHTNACRPRAMARYREKHKDYLALHPEDEPLLQMVEGVSERGILGALAAIDGAYPTLEAFFEAEYGLDAAALARLRALYLE